MQLCEAALKHSCALSQILVRMLKCSQFNAVGGKGNAVNQAVISSPCGFLLKPASDYMSAMKNTPINRLIS